MLTCSANLLEEVSEESDSDDQGRIMRPPGRITGTKLQQLMGLEGEKSQYNQFLVRHFLGLKCLTC